MNIGDAVRYYRKLYNLTQSEVAELAGINEKYLGRIERSESVPSIDKVQQLCMAFDIKVSDLLTIHPDKLESEQKIIDKDPQSMNEGLCEIYYCNCCGCTFQAKENSQDEIRCPNCDCLYCEENEYIEKYSAF